jgi:exosome complex component CSL4
MSLPSAPVYPGTFLGSRTSYISGPGTHILSNNIYASLHGTVSSIQAPTTSSGTKISRQKPTLTIAQTSPTPSSIPSRQVTRRNVLPFVNAVVLARVTRLQSRQANVAIVVVDGVTCADEFAGVVRKEDVRGWEVDKVKIEEAFRVGDVVRAVVVRLFPFLCSHPQTWTLS